ncbi:unnamed protein product [Amoebophrya sp. A25]|nr:unnamed protein product [Amoebophrya sp. A25]|eukprot:GSA25T00002016001.1
MELPATWEESCDRGQRGRHDDSVATGGIVSLKDIIEKEFAEAVESLGASVRGARQFFRSSCDRLQIPRRKGETATGTGVGGQRWEWEARAIGVGGLDQVRAAVFQYLKSCGNGNGQAAGKKRRRSDNEKPQRPDQNRKRRKSSAPRASGGAASSGGESSSYGGLSARSCPASAPAQSAGGERKPQQDQPALRPENARARQGVGQMHLRASRKLKPEKGPAHSPTGDQVDLTRDHEERMKRARLHRVNPDLRDKCQKLTSQELKKAEVEARGIWKNRGHYQPRPFEEIIPLPSSVTLMPRRNAVAPAPQGEDNGQLWRRLVIAHEPGLLNNKGIATTSQGCTRLGQGTWGTVFKALACTQEALQHLPTSWSVSNCLKSNAAQGGTLGGEEQLLDSKGER